VVEEDLEVGAHELVGLLDEGVEAGEVGVLRVAVALAHGDEVEVLGDAGEVLALVGGEGRAGHAVHHVVGVRRADGRVDEAVVDQVAHHLEHLALARLRELGAQLQAQHLGQAAQAERQLAHRAHDHAQELGGVGAHRLQVGVQLRPHRRVLQGALGRGLVGQAARLAALRLHPADPRLVQLARAQAQAHRLVRQQLLHQRAQQLAQHVLPAVLARQGEKTGEKRGVCEGSAVQGLPVQGHDDFDD